MKLWCACNIDHTSMFARDVLFVGEGSSEAPTTQQPRGTQALQEKVASSTHERSIKAPRRLLQAVLVAVLSWSSVG